MIIKRLLFDTVGAYIDSPEAIIIMGMRRTGKTTLLNYIYSQISSENKIFLDLENTLNRRYFEEENYERIKTSFEFLGVDFACRAFILLDEIQFVKKLPSVVKYFIDHYQVKFFLTGSARFYLKNLFTESLAGRKYIFELYPLSFSEFLIFKGISFKVPENASQITKNVFDTISPLFEEYILYGGFPGVVLKTSVEEKKKSLDEIFSSFFQQEVLQLGDFRRNNVVRDLILLLAERIGSKLDILKLSRELGVSRTTLYEYISFLEGTYFIKIIRPFSRGKNTEIRKMPKFYLCDTGLANHLSKLDMGRLFENSVFQSLRLKGEINYYQRKSGGEIDFILNKKTAYEVKLNPRESDLKKLQAMISELNIGEFKIISKKYSDLENIVYGFML